MAQFANSEHISRKKSVRFAESEGDSLQKNEINFNHNQKTKIMTIRELKKNIISIKSIIEEIRLMRRNLNMDLKDFDDIKQEHAERVLNALSEQKEYFISILSSYKEKFNDKLSQAEKLKDEILALYKEKNKLENKVLTVEETQEVKNIDVEIYSIYGKNLEKLLELLGSDDFFTFMIRDNLAEYE